MPPSQSTERIAYPCPPIQPESRPSGPESAPTMQLDLTDEETFTLLNLLTETID
jgi:hypothetical protein